MDTQKLKIVSAALNEIVNGVGVPDLYLKLGAEKNNVDTLSEKLKEVSQKAYPNTHEWNCEELKLQRNILCEVLKELDSFEFETRLGYSEGETFLALKEVKEKIDSVCH